MLEAAKICLLTVPNSFKNFSKLNNIFLFIKKLINIGDAQHDSCVLYYCQTDYLRNWLGTERNSYQKPQVYLNTLNNNTINFDLNYELKPTTFVILCFRVNTQNT